MIQITKTKPSRVRGTWVGGKTNNGYSFSAKVSEKPSQFGLRASRGKKTGRICILEIRDSMGVQIFNYYAPKLLIKTTEGTALAFEIINRIESLNLGAA